VAPGGPNFNTASFGPSSHRLRSKVRISFVIRGLSIGHVFKYSTTLGVTVFYRVLALSIGPAERDINEIIHFSTDEEWFSSFRTSVGTYQIGHRSAP
jgi:hypothetical protein